MKGLDPEGPLNENLRRIVAVRGAELRGLGSAVLDPGDVHALHDTRIAAKRLRYVLELGEPVLGPNAADGAKRARHIQHVLGELHDCDETLPRIARVLERLRGEDATAIRAGLAPNASDVDPESLRRARHRRKYAGLESLAAYTRARRDVLYAEFLRIWTDLEQSGTLEWLGAGAG